MDEVINKGQWFVIQTLSGQENKVRDSISRQIQLGDAVGVYEVYMPQEKVTEVKHGDRRVITRKTFPGYIFVRMDLYDEMTHQINEAAWYFVRNIQGVIGFVGDGRAPVPLSEYEVSDMFRSDEEPEKAKPKIIYELGETVRIREGAFENFDGVIEEIDAERGKLKLMVSIFGRSTPVELEFWQVDRGE